MRSSRDKEFTAFVTARQAHLRRVAIAVCGDPHRAEDVLQNALTKLYLAWPRVRHDGREEAYVRQIIVRADIDDRRRPWRRETPSADEHDRAATGEASVEDRSVLFQALQELPGLQRRAVLLRHWLGLSVAQAAVELDVSQGTVKSASSRGVASLRRHLLELDAHDERRQFEPPVAGPQVIRRPRSPRAAPTGSPSA